MGMEDDFLQNDVDDEKTIEYIKNYLPQELKEKFSDDEFYYFLDLIDEYYSESASLMRSRMRMGTSRLIWGKSWTILSRKPIRMRWVTMIRKKSFSSYKVRWNIRNLWTKNSLYQSIGKSRMSMASSRFLFLCSRWRIQKKEDGRADEDDTQYAVEQAACRRPTFCTINWVFRAVKNQFQSNMAASKAVMPATAKIP